MCGHDIFEGSFWLPGFESKTWVILPNVLFHLGSHARPEEPVTYEVKHALQAQMTNLIMASSESNLPLCSWQDQLKEGLLWFPGPGLSVQNTLLSSKWLHSHLYWLILGGSVVLDWPFLSIPSLSLAMTRLGAGSTSWAWCQSPRVTQVTSLLSWIASKMCRSQL